MKVMHFWSIKDKNRTVSAIEQANEFLMFLTCTNQKISYRDMNADSRSSSLPYAIS